MAIPLAMFKNFLKKHQISIPLFVFLALMFNWLLIGINPPNYAYHPIAYYISIGFVSFTMLTFAIVWIVWYGFKSFIRNIFTHLGVLLIVVAITSMNLYYITLVSIVLTKSEVVEVEVFEQYFSRGGGRLLRGSCIKWKVRLADGSESSAFCTNKPITIMSPKTIAKVRLTQTWIADKIYHFPLPIENDDS